MGHFYEHIQKEHNLNWTRQIWGKLRLSLRCDEYRCGVRAPEGPGWYLEFKDVWAKSWSRSDHVAQSLLIAIVFTLSRDLLDKGYIIFMQKCVLKPDTCKGSLFFDNPYLHRICIHNSWNGVTNTGYTLFYSFSQRVPWFTSFARFTVKLAATSVSTTKPH